MKKDLWCGLCEIICHEVFKIDTIAYEIEEVSYAENTTKIKKAAGCRPKVIIKFSEQQQVNYKQESIYNQN